MVMTISEAFEDRGVMEELLSRTGAGEKEANHLVQVEGFTDMKILTSHAPKTSDFRKMLEDINKSLGAASSARKVFFGRVVMSKILAIHYYTTKCISINKLPDVRVINIDKAVGLMTSLERFKDIKLDHQKEWNQVAKFNGENWPSFKSKFTALLKSIVGVRDCALHYVIRKDNGSQDSGLEEEMEPDLSDPDIFTTQLTLDGPDYAVDNTKLYSLLSGFMIETRLKIYI